MKNPPPQDEFVGYIGEPDFHDAVVVKLNTSGRDVEVVIRSEASRFFKIRFLNVQDIQSNRSNGMMLYALAELKATPVGRRFSFVNWDEKDDALLELTATDYLIEQV
jgi:hypothetical protein